MVLLQNYNITKHRYRYHEFGTSNARGLGLMVVTTIILPFVGFLTFRNIYSTVMIYTFDASSSLIFPSVDTHPRIVQFDKGDIRRRTSVLRGGNSQSSSIKTSESVPSVKEASTSVATSKAPEKGRDKFSRRYGITKKHMKEDGGWVQEIGDLLECPEVSSRGIKANDGKAYSHIPGNDTW